MQVLNLLQKRSAIVWGIIIIIPLIFSLWKIGSGAFPFWYDPARDLLLALANLKKVSFIGPPSGIPSIFYGPYWIWMLSIAILIHPDPKTAIIFTGIIPYFVILPFLLFRMKKYFGDIIPMTLWVVFIFNYENYATNLWNPYPAPLILFGICYLVLSMRNDKTLWSKTFLMGILSGLMLNFHISFGSGVLLGTLIYFFVSDFFARNSASLTEWILMRLKQYIVFGVGVFIPFIPFLIFELRHHFLQTKAIIFTVTNSLIYGSAVVGQTGLTKTEIFPTFLKAFFLVFHGSGIIISMLAATSIGLIIYSIVSRKMVEERYSKLLAFLIIISSTILYTYFSSRNPIWEYHFIGVEVIMIMLSAYIMYRFQIIKILLIVWALFTFFSGIYTHIVNDKIDPRTIPHTYAAIENSVNTIYADTHGKVFAYAAYSPSIYTYDYDYEFKFYNKTYNNIAQTNIPTATLVYLIIPPQTKKITRDDFVTYKTSSKAFKTFSSWKLPDGTEIIKREKI